MAKRSIIVIGASSGGFAAIQELVKSFPKDLNAAVFIVWHMAADAKGILPDALNKLGTLPAAHAKDREPVKNGRIYVALPDHHLLLDKDEVRVTRGPKENRFRPAVDPLFRSAAYAYGSCVIGIILSGAMDDGSAGLWMIKQRGGVAIVQDFQEAEFPAMPLNASKATEVDYITPVAKMGALLSGLVEEEAGPEQDCVEGNERAQMEIDIAMEKDIDFSSITKYGEWSPYTCPECHGALTAFTEGGRTRYRCHQGHAYSIDNLLAAIAEATDGHLSNAICSMEENIMLLNNLGDHYAEMNQPKPAAAFFKKAKETEGRMQMIKPAIRQDGHLSQDTTKARTGNKK